MEITEYLAKMTVDDEPKMAFIGTLLHNEPCGVIVKGIAFFDKVLLPDVLLAYLRKHGPAVAGYTEAQVGKKSLFDKINALAALKLSPDAAVLRDSAVAKLTPMRKIRNTSAHEAALTSQQAEELWAEVDCRALLAEFPVNFKADSAAVQVALQGLLSHPDFIDK